MTRLTTLATIRQRQTPLARRALGLFVLAWLNIALQPCAMAMGGDDSDDCPRCPMSHTGQHNDHSTSAPAKVERTMPCASDVDDCNPLETINVDSRTASYKLKDMPSDLPVAMLPSATLLADADYREVRDASSIKYRPPDNSPPLNVLYCVYLK